MAKQGMALRHNTEDPIKNLITHNLILSIDLNDISM